MKNKVVNRRLLSSVVITLCSGLMAPIAAGRLPRDRT